MNMSHRQSPKPSSGSDSSLLSDCLVHTIYSDCTILYFTGALVRCVFVTVNEYP